MSEKILKTQDCSCPSCGASMRYSPQKRTLYCENCQTCKNIDFVALTIKHAWEERDELKNLTDFAKETKALKCPNCGANVILNKLEYSKACPYCGSNLVNSTAEATNLAPDGIIPFTYSDEEASALYVKGLKKKWFLPNKFKKAPPIDSIKGVYIPAFGYDADTKSTYKGVLATDHVHRDSRGHSYTTTTYKHISGTYDSLQRDVLVETSSKINQNEFEKIKPYSINKAVEFKQGFIMGYTVEAYEDSIEKCKKIADELMKQNIKEGILSRYSYDRVQSFDMQVTMFNQMYMYYLLPIYKCDYIYKQKKYTTIMNGQTGKVGGGYPKSGVKITFFVLFLIAIVVGLIILFFNYAEPDLLIK